MQRTCFSSLYSIYWKKCFTWSTFISNIALLAHAEPVLTPSPVTAIVGAGDARAIFTQKSWPALARSVDAEPLIRAVVQTSGHRAVVSGEGFLTHALSIDTHSLSWAVSGTSGLRAVLSSGIAKTLSVDAKTLSGAVRRASWLGTVLPCPAFVTNAAAHVHAEGAVTTALRKWILVT